MLEESEDKRLEESEDERQEESEDEWQEESEDERQEESEDGRQDALVDDAPVRGGDFGDREKQNLGVGWSTSKQKDNWSKMDVQEKAWSS